MGPQPPIEARIRFRHPGKSGGLLPVRNAIDSHFRRNEVIFKGLRHAEYQDAARLSDALTLPGNVDILSLRGQSIACRRAKSFFPCAFMQFPQASRGKLFHEARRFGPQTGENVGTRGCAVAA